MANSPLPLIYDPSLQQCHQERVLFDRYSIRHENLCYAQCFKNVWVVLFVGGRRNSDLCAKRKGSRMIAVWNHTTSKQRRFLSLVVDFILAVLQHTTRATARRKFNVHGGWKANTRSAHRCSSRQNQQSNFHRTSSALQKPGVN